MKPTRRHCAHVGGCNARRAADDGGQLGARRGEPACQRIRAVRRHLQPAASAGAENGAAAAGASGGGGGGYAQRHGDLAAQNHVRHQRGACAVLEAAAAGRQVQHAGQRVGRPQVKEDARARAAGPEFNDGVFEGEL